MCIVVVKKRGVELPSDETLKNCWDRNPDGAGFMYTGQEGETFIRKGYMKFEAFMDSYNSHTFNKKDLLVLHFRIKTHGKLSECATHPFPVSRKTEDLRDLHIESEIGIAHNGMIPKFNSNMELSDTQLFIKKVLSKENYYKGLMENNPLIIEKIEDKIGCSRMAVLSKGKITLIGDPWERDKGLIFSNSTYKPYKVFDHNRYTFERGDWYLAPRKCGNSSEYSHRTLEKAFILKAVQTFYKHFRGDDTQYNTLYALSNTYLELLGMYDLTFLGRISVEDSFSNELLNSIQGGKVSDGFITKRNIV